jgi:hypothetical protein
MQADILEAVFDRISTTINETGIVDDYRELLLSVVIQSVRRYQSRCENKLPAIALPELWCVGLGGESHRVVGVTAAWFLLQLAAFLLDKVEDDELDQTTFATLGVGPVSNLTTGLIFLSQWILNRLEVDDGIDYSTATDIRAMFSTSILNVCGGQHIDLTAKNCLLEQVWNSFKMKSGLFFALACFSGARLATNDPKSLNACLEYGKNLGVLLQIADEREDLSKEVPDLWKSSNIFNAYYNEVMSSGLLMQKDHFASSINSFWSGLQVYLNVQSHTLWRSGMAAMDDIQAELKTRPDLVRLLSQSV